MNPVCLLQWLPSDDFKETKIALTNFSDQINISHYDVYTKNDAHDGIKDWLNNNPNSQFLFIGAHGILDDNNNSIGLGSSSNEFVTWQELWEWLKIAICTPVLWLGACKSSDVANAWSPFPNSPKRVSWICGFSEEIYPIEIKKVLLRLMTTTSINPIIYVDDQLEYLRKEIPETKIELFFPAYTLQGQCEYVNEDEFERKVGVTFKNFLKQSNC